MKSIFSSRRNKNPHNNEEAEKKETPFFSKDSKSSFFNTAEGGSIQTKLSVGKPGDKYEKEADSMADAVVGNSASKPDIQNKEISSIQRESLATPQEDEKLGTAEQRMEEDKLVQEKPELQKMEGPEEEEGLISKMDDEKEDEGMINKMEDDEEEVTPDVQAKGSGGNKAASNHLSQKIKSKSGTGSKLSESARAEMESSFGRDFSDVSIHTDTDAVQMNKELGAKAFTHGKDVYFNSGNFNPETSEGKHLLAHELTHVVQQNQPDKKSVSTSSNSKPAIQTKGDGQKDPLHDSLLDQYSKASGIPRDEVNQHQEGYRQWLFQNVSKRPQLAVSLTTPGKIPSPDHFRTKKQLGAWETANFRYKPQVSFNTDKIIKSGVEHSYVKQVQYLLKNPKFEYAIAKEIYDDSRDRTLDPLLRHSWREVYKRIRRHSRKHFAIYRRVVSAMENELIAHLSTLPGKGNPLDVPQQELDAYLTSYLTYFTAKLEYKLWKATCDLEKKDYPNFLKGIYSIRGRLKVNCGPRPKVPPIPLMPVSIKSKKAGASKKKPKSKK
ncbi:MAG: DUF4157 domain-containing protein [Bacteroidota bacterium]